MELGFASQSGFCCGVDEVGRGPLAGPVVTAAVVLGLPMPGLADSKQLSERDRTVFAKRIHEHALAVSIGRADVFEIDRLNILQATLLAMRRAVEGLPVTATLALIDGNRLPSLPTPAVAVVKGDARIPAISAASIVAKVARDREMVALAERYPCYGFERHKGYGTRQHLEALERFGPCPLHRHSFAPVRARVCSRGRSGASPAE